MLHLRPKFRSTAALDAHPTYHYMLDGHIIDEPNTVRDLGVIIDTDLNFQDHIRSIVQQASVRASVVRRSFKNTSVAFHVQMYKTFIRPLVEYAMPVWSPQYDCDGLSVELVQKRFTKYLPNYFYLSYQQRLDKLDIVSLGFRRSVADLVLLYKLARGHCCVDLSNFGVHPAPARAGHEYRFYNIAAAKNVRHHYFSSRAIRLWNSLSVNTHQSPTLNCFRQRLMKDAHFLKIVSPA